MTTIQCDITIDPNGISSLGKSIKELPKQYSQYIFIIDEQVAKNWESAILNSLNAEGLNVSVIHLSGSEEVKNLQTAIFCWEEIHKLHADRDALLIAVGGGVITDLCGFVASTYMRGIDLFLVPTTLLSMVDAAIGGKNGVNFSETKNLIGSFHLPQKIVIDPTFLKTLPPREVSAGMAEMIKIAAIADKEFFTYLENNMDDLLTVIDHKLTSIINHACKIKTEIVKADARDHGVRALLNYGHTFGHAIESALNYKNILHGEAVSIGMSCAAHLSKELGLIDQSILERQENLCRKAKLPTALPDIQLDQLLKQMRKDKKVALGRMSFILIDQIGHGFKHDKVTEEQVLAALSSKRN